MRVYVRVLCTCVCVCVCVCVVCVLFVCRWVDKCCGRPVTISPSDSGDGEKSANVEVPDFICNSDHVATLNRLLELAFAAHLDQVSSSALYF